MSPGLKTLIFILSPYHFDNHPSKTEGFLITPIYPHNNRKIRKPNTGKPLPLCFHFFYRQAQSLAYTGKSNEKMQNHFRSDLKKIKPFYLLLSIYATIAIAGILYRILY